MIELTVEDGLRLSELYGQQAQLQYEMEHVLATHLSDIVLMMFLVVMVMAFMFLLNYATFDLGSISWSISSDEKERIRRRYHTRNKLIVVSGILLAAVILAAMLVYIPIDIQHEMVGVEAQIDEILGRYA